MDTAKAKMPSAYNLAFMMEPDHRRTLVPGGAQTAAYTGRLVLREHDARVFLPIAAR